ncbi:MAG: aspartate aminotransferase family protein [Clostridiales bacterium]|nr:aspartate aminotransferase family protein [Clostridiales bacterium]
MAKGKQFNLNPKAVPEVHTAYRTIQTPIPNKESVEIIEKLRKYEPRSMSGQPPVVWDRAEGFNVYDAQGNKWLDFSSCVVVANAGHCNPDVKKAILDMTEHGLLNNYVFPSDIRSRLVEKIIQVAPKELKKVFLLTTGAESTECALKLARTFTRARNPEKNIVITFNDSFHGRTLGAQMAGGSASEKRWIRNLDPEIVQIPFPNSFKYEWADQSREDYSDDVCFEKLMEYIRAQGITDYSKISAVMTETFQGGWCELMPSGVLRKLRKFCDDYGIVLIYDEVQGGFGRTGKMFGFMHAGIVPDLVCCGKGISSSLPLSCVIGREDIMDVYGPGEMTSTHSGNPVSCAAALASINYIVENKVVEHCAELEKLMKKRIEALKEKYGDRIGFARGTGLAWAVIPVMPGTKELDSAFAHDVVRIAMEKGLLMFAPVGSGATLKLAPPLIITEDALNEAMDVFDESIKQAIAEQS